MYCFVLPLSLLALYYFYHKLISAFSLSSLFDPPSSVGTSDLQDRLMAIELSISVSDGMQIFDLRQGTSRCSFARYGMVLPFNKSTVHRESPSQVAVINGPI